VGCSPQNLLLVASRQTGKISAAHPSKRIQIIVRSPLITNTRQSDTRQPASTDQPANDAARGKQAVCLPNNSSHLMRLLLDGIRLDAPSIFLVPTPAGSALERLLEKIASTSPKYSPAPRQFRLGYSRPLQKPMVWYSHPSRQPVCRLMPRSRATRQCGYTNRFPGLFCVRCHRSNVLLVIKHLSSPSNMKLGDRSIPCRRQPISFDFGYLTYYQAFR